MDTRVKTASGINVVAGLWLIISPFLFGLVGGVVANSIIVGIIVAVLALIRALNPEQAMWASYVNIVLGVWLIVSAFIMGVSMIAFWNFLILGVIVAGLSLVGSTSSSMKMHPKM